jgi:putative ABC transport system permease protein
MWGDAFRVLRYQKIFALTVVLTLAAAIGANTAMFTVIRAVLLKPLQYPEAGRLVSISGGATPTRFSEMKAGARSLSGIGAFSGQEDLTLSGSGAPEVVQGARVSAGFLRILGIDPLRGRDFRPEEDAAGAARVALISWDLWRRRFAGDPHLVGKSFTIAAEPVTIIGVLPPRFAFPFPGLDVWMTAPSDWPLVPVKSRSMSPFLSLFGRLAPGQTVAQANTEIRVLRQRYALAHPTMLDAKKRPPVEVAPLQEHLVGSVRAILWTLFGAVGCVLFIACANVAGLLLARGASRSREFAVRSALGAGRGRLIAQVLAESAVLSLAGGSLGVFLAALSLRAIPSITSFDLPRAAEIHLDPAVLAFAAALSVVTGMLFGLAPSLGASRPDLMSVLRTAGAAAHQSMPSRFHLRGFLSAGQVAVSVVLLIGAALLLESVARMRRVEVGFNPAHLLTLRVSLPPARYDTTLKKSVFFRQLLDRVETLPGVNGAAAALTLPMMGYAGIPVQDASKPLLPLNERLIATYLDVTPNYVSTLGIPLRRGRTFNEHDTEDAPRVAMIDEALARRLWPQYPAGPDPVGQRLWVGGVNAKPAEIVGIVADVHQSLEPTAWPESVYVSFAQNPFASAMLAVRTAGQPLALVHAIRDQVRRIDPDQPVTAVQTMDELVDAVMGQRRLLSILLASFTAVALLLALMGIWGVVAYSVAQRRQEVGIRRALGAQQGDILRVVMGEAFALAAAGVAVGVGGAFLLTRVLRSLLFQVSATDPVTFITVPSLFLAIALLAAYIPARRAGRIDPMSALRI